MLQQLRDEKEAQVLQCRALESTNVGLKEQICMRDVKLRLQEQMRTKLQQLRDENKALEEQIRLKDDELEEARVKLKKPPTSVAEISKCKYFEQCVQAVNILPDVVRKFLNFEEHAMCYCSFCHNARGDQPTYNRGGKTYAMPKGWARIALLAGGAQAEALEAFQWHVAFHGTEIDVLPNILATGRLVKPGDAVAALGGESVGIREGHYRNAFPRRNAFTGKMEHFDSNQIFLSPSIKYCESPAYAKHSPVTDAAGKKWKVQVAFQVRLRPGTYSIGQETLDFKGSPIDEHFSNNEIEWYTDGMEHGSHVLTGFLMKLT